YLPLSYDEAYTFLQFVDRSLFYAFCTYPAPNNHVFHSIFSNFSWHLFSWSHLNLFIRLPAIIASVLLFAVFSKRIAKKDILLIACFMVLILLNLPFLSFSFQARGYSMQILFAVVSVLFINKPSTNDTFKFNNQSILLFSLMGLYTSPAYLFTFLGIYSVFFIQNLNLFKKNIAYIFYTTLFFSCTIILLYAPIMVFRGYESITNNRFVRPLESFNIPFLASHYKSSLTEITGGSVITILIFTLFIWFSISKKKWPNFLILIVPFLLMMVLNQAPFTRVFLPISFSIIAFVFLDIKLSFKPNSLKRHVISGVIVCIALAVSTYNFFKIPNGGLQSSVNVKYLSKYFDSHLKIHDETHDYLKTAIIGNLISSKKPYEIITSETEIKKGSIILFSENFNDNIKIIDSTDSYNKKVFIGIMED
ncbi:hypothetical protein, partial [Algibacter sp.]|uniref:hypothetical protein n=1 Tax=Algibacter sp. TaxID=1872428 RepID=UPI003C795468